MPRKAKQRKWDKKKQAAAVKQFRKKKSKVKKVTHTKEDGFQYNEYVDKKESAWSPKPLIKWLRLAES